MSLGIYCYGCNQVRELPPVEGGYKKLASLVDESLKSLTFLIQEEIFENCESDFEENAGVILTQLESIFDEEKQKKVTLYLAERLAKCGDYTNALDVLDIVSESYQAQLAIRDIFLKLIEQERYDIVLQRKNVLNDKYYVSVVMCSLAAAYRLKGMLQTALNIVTPYCPSYGVPNEITNIARVMFQEGRAEQAKKTLQPIGHHYIAKQLVKEFE